MTRSVSLVDFTSDHLDGAVALSSSLGWAHTRDDWAMLQSHSAGRAAIVDARVVGTVFRTDFGANLSSLNMVIVAQELRGQGVGRTLVKSVIESKPSRDLRLVSTSSGKALYRKLGFEETWHVLQMQGRVDRVPDALGASKASASDQDMIVRLDREMFGADRTWLVNWIYQNGHLAVVRHGDFVTGFAAMRRFGRGHVIGPVVAPDLDAAVALVSHLTRQIPDEFLRLDIAANCGLQPWLEDIGLSPVDRAPVMQRGEKHASQRYFALFSQALG